MAPTTTGVTVARFRPGHHHYYSLYQGVSRMTACKCECGAIRDATNRSSHQSFCEWAMNHRRPAVIHIAAGINWSGPTA